MNATLPSHSAKAFTLGLLAAAVLALPATGQDAPKATQMPIPDDIWAEMEGVSWHDNLPCPRREELALLKVPHHDFEGKTQTGELIVAKSEAENLIKVFNRLYADGFRIERMERVDKYGGNDRASMAVNNTSAFNCRVVSGTTRLSQHALGKAIDINPIQNPWVSGNSTSPPAGRPYDTLAERKPDIPGIVVKGDAVVRAFASVGWKWGGNWTRPVDYQHFSANGR